MADTIYTYDLRVAVISSIFKGTAFPEYNLYLSIYGADPSDPVGDRIHMRPGDWELDVTSNAASVGNVSQVTFTGLPVATTNGIVAFDSDVGMNYVFYKSYTPIDVVAGQVITFSPWDIELDLIEQ